MRSLLIAALAILPLWHPALAKPEFKSQSFALPAGDHPHDAAPAPDGSVWYTAQYAGALGQLDPDTGKVKHVPLGKRSAPHGVIVGPDGAPWITDGGLNAIVRVDPRTLKIKRFPLPSGSGYANLNTAIFDNRGILWFTGQSGIYGRLDPKTGKLKVFDAPQGYGPYGVTATPKGDVYYASLAGSYVASINTETGEATVIEPPTKNQGARRVWSDSTGRIWVSEWNSGQLSVYNPASKEWRSWRLPGKHPRTYAVYVDDKDIVWVSDFGANAILRFNPQTETLTAFPSPRPDAEVRQISGREGEVWLPESGTDHLMVLYTD